MSTDRPDPSRPDEPLPGLDVDAAFADIVAHWDSTPADDVTGEPSGTDSPESAGAEPPAADPQESLGRLFTPAWRQEPEPSPAPWDDEEHFVPPPPPPVPRPAPGRLLAWAGLLGTPAVALLLVVLHAAVPRWATLGLVLAFVGGFGYLVATMTTEPPDHWSGDDGARL